MRTNVQIDFKEVGWEAVGWINLVQDRGMCQTVVDMVMNPWVP
jgi:hypothetical protein